MAKKSRITEGDSKLGGQRQLDAIDRSDWPDEVFLEAPEATTEGVAKSADRINPAKQPGTTGEKPFPYPSVDEMRQSQKTGAEGRGLPENCVDQLNEAQGHSIQIKR